MIRPSNLERVAACPGSVRMERGLPDEETPERREGQDLHSFQAHPEYERKFLTPKMQELLKTSDDLDQQLFDGIVQNEKIKDSDEYVEQREIEDQWHGLVGHMDLRRRYPKRGITVIRDSKFGYIPVERAEMNMQLRGYAVTSEDESVYVAITQPRAPFGQRITVAKYDRDAIALAQEEIAKIIDRANEPDAPLKAGDHCRYCRARALCPELAKAVGKGLVPLGVIDDDLSKAKKLGIVEARLAQVSDDNLGKMLNAYSLIQFIYDPMMDEARRRIEKGAMPEWKLGKALERRKITDSQKAISLLALAGMSREDIMECANLSLTKLEEKLNKGELRTGQVITGVKDAKNFTNRVLSSVLETEVGKARVLRK